jgi:hypothetical protein
VEGENALAKITLAGGRHRVFALEICKAEAEKKISQYKLEVEALSKSTNDDSDSNGKALEDAKGLLNVWKEKLASYGIWGVVVFDEGISISDV